MSKAKSKNTKSRKKQHDHKTQSNLQPEKSSFVEKCALVFIALLGIVIYSNSFNCSFHLDDLSSIEFNNSIKNNWDVKSLWSYSQTRFIPYLTFAVNYQLGEFDLWGYHFVNFVIHLINTYLVWWLTLLIFSTPVLKNHTLSRHKKSIAILTALLFVSHPLATQSVTYIVQRIASLSAMFYFLSIALYLQARISQNSTTTKYVFFVASFVSAILAFLSKENAFTLPFVIVLLEVFFLRTNKWSFNIKNFYLILIGTVITLSGFIVILVMRYSSSVFKALPPDFTTDYKNITPVNYLLTQFSVIPKYIQLLLLPVNQNLDYDYTLSTSFFKWQTIGGFIILLLLLILAIFLFKKNRIISFGILFFFLTLSIESSIIPLGDLIFEHRTYLPSFGFFIILVSTIYTLLWNNHKKMAIGLFTIIILSNSILAFARNKVWENDETLWTDVISKSPNKARPYNSRGTYYWRNKQYEDAIKDYSKAIELHPDYLEAYYNRALCYSNLQKYNEALMDYSKMIQLNPNNVPARKARIEIYEKENKPDLAYNDYGKLIELEPNEPTFYINRARILASQNKIDSALADYTKAIQLQPTNSLAYYNKGLLYQNEKKNELAIQNYTKAIEYKPAYFEAYINRANVYSSMNQYDQALSDLNKAISINPDFELAYYNRGLLFLNRKQFKEAIEDFTKAIKINPNYSKATYNRGLAEFSLGDTQAACADWKRALSLGYQPAADIIRLNCK